MRYIGGMKTLFLPVIVALTFLTPDVVLAKGKKHAPQPPAATPIPLPSASNPVEALSPYITNLEQLLSFERADSTANQPLFTQTSGLLTTLRQSLVVEQEKADAKLKNMFTAAINTADLIVAALNDRDAALANLKTSQSVAGGQKLEAPSKKDNLAQGIHGGGIGKAEAVAVERDREKQFQRQAAKQTGADQNAMTSMAMNQWNQRAAAWRQRIAASFSQIK
jgi:hypothetical protein